jgi:ACS family hexuronate transporter-like MFS transporter
MNQLKAIGNYRWTICALVFFATTINYLDRQVISLLKPFLESDGLFGDDPAHMNPFMPISSFVSRLPMLRECFL